MRFRLTIRNVNWRAESSEIIVKDGFRLTIRNVNCYSASILLLHLPSFRLTIRNVNSKRYLKGDVCNIVLD